MWECMYQYSPQCALQSLDQQNQKLHNPIHTYINHKNLQQKQKKFLEKMNRILLPLENLRIKINKNLSKMQQEIRQVKQTIIKYIDKLILQNQQLQIESNSSSLLKHIKDQKFHRLTCEQLHHFIKVLDQSQAQERKYQIDIKDKVKKIERMENDSKRKLEIKLKELVKFEEITKEDNRSFLSEMNKSKVFKQDLPSISQIQHTQSQQTLSLLESQQESNKSSFKKQKNIDKIYHKIEQEDDGQNYYKTKQKRQIQLSTKIKQEQPKETPSKIKQEQPKETLSKIKQEQPKETPSKIKQEQSKATLSKIKQEQTKETLSKIKQEQTKESPSKPNLVDNQFQSKQKYKNIIFLSFQNNQDDQNEEEQNEFFFYMLNLSMRETQKAVMNKKAKKLIEYTTIKALAEIYKMINIDQFKFNIKVKVVKILYYFHIDRISKIKFVGGDHTGLAIIVTNYFDKIQLNCQLDMQNCSIYKFKEVAPEIKNYKDFRIMKQSQGSINVKMNGLKLNQYLNDQLYYQLSHFRCTLIRQACKMIKNKNNKLIKKMMVKVICIMNKIDNVIVALIGDSSGMIQAQLKDTKNQIKQQAILVLRRVQIHGGNKQNNILYIDATQQKSAIYIYHQKFCQIPSKMMLIEELKTM